MSAVFLEQDAQDAGSIARLLADFVGQASSTLEVAIYDLHLEPANRDLVATAFEAAIKRGVEARLVYNRMPPRRPAEPGGPMPTVMDVPFLLRVPGMKVRVVPGVPNLMHHKYLVRDRSSVWTGSTNWTDDSWQRMENVIVRVDAPAVAALYTADFEELWATRAVRHSGHESVAWVEAGRVPMRAFFTPQRATQLVHAIAAAIYGAQTRVRVCSPVLTSGPILMALADRPVSDAEVSGVLDATQMHAVLTAWDQDGNTTKPPLFQTVLERFTFSGKHSTPWRPEGSVHDFMHAKCVVADDDVFVGSFNLSRNGETNAENVVQVRDRGLADLFVAYIDRVAARYPPYPPPPARQPGPPDPPDPPDPPGAAGVPPAS